MTFTAFVGMLTWRELVNKSVQKSLHFIKPFFTCNLQQIECIDRDKPHLWKWQQIWNFLLLYLNLTCEDIYQIYASNMNKQQQKVYYRFSFYTLWSWSPHGETQGQSVSIEKLKKHHKDLTSSSRETRPQEGRVTLIWETVKEDTVFKYGVSCSCKSTQMSFCHSIEQVITIFHFSIQFYF